jgi:hypothetical protein
MLHDVLLKREKAEGKRRGMAEVLGQRASKF